MEISFFSTVFCHEGSYIYLVSRKYVNFNIMVIIGFVLHGFNPLPG